MERTVTLIGYGEALTAEERRDFFTSLPTVVVAPFLSFMERDNIWEKFTCPERLSKMPPPQYADFVPFARAVVERFPDRVLWGADWPHPNYNMVGHMPDDGALVDFIPHIAPTAELQHKLLVDNPMRLYGPEEA